MAVYMTTKEKLMKAGTALGISLGKEVLSLAIDLICTKFDAQKLAEQMVRLNIQMESEICRIIQKHQLSNEAASDLQYAVRAYENLVQRLVEESQNCTIIVNRNDRGEVVSVDVKMSLIPKGIKKLIEKKGGKNKKGA